MAQRYPITSLVSIGLIILNLMAWVVLLGGAAGLQKDHATVVGLLNLVNTQPGAILSFGDLKPQSTNQNYLSYEWFKAVLQAVILLGALGALAMGALYHSRIALVGMFSVATVLFCDAADTFYYIYLQVHNNPVVPKKIRQEVSTYFAGCIMTATLNFLIIISLGLGHGHPVGTTTAAATHTGPTVTKDTTNGAAAV